MEDWRLRGQEDYLSNITLYKVRFPEFWQLAYETKNPFYQKIAAYANEQVARTGKWAEFLEDEKIGQFWHEHCEFCWEKADIQVTSEFYCTEDMYYWVCAECFKDFAEQFNWQERPVEELFPQAVTVHEMKLRPEPFGKIRSGTKTIELRLYDEKRQKIQVGDVIEFTCTEGGEMIRATVKALHLFDSFAELYDTLPLLQCGYTAEDLDSALPSDMEAYYSAQAQEKYGVLGIELFFPE